MYSFKKLFCLFSTAIFTAMPSFGWGQMGHDVVAAVAQEHLTPKAKKQISAILDGKSIVYWANWMDNASNTKKYAYTKTWHYKNIENATYETMPAQESGDVITALDSQIAALKSGDLSKEGKALALKMIVHFMGDVHAPMHFGKVSDLGGNKVQVQFFGNGRNLHKIWDSDILASGHKWSYSEWVEQIDIKDKKSIKLIVRGNPYEWGRQTSTITAEIYQTTAPGEKLSFYYVNKWTPVIERQLLYGGLRLAEVLNDIFK